MNCPMRRAACYTVVQGHHGSFSHTGQDEYAIDWQMPEGTPVHAARDGLVVKVEGRLVGGRTGAANMKTWRTAFWSNTRTGR